MSTTTDHDRKKRQAIIHPLAGADPGVYFRRYFANRPYGRPPSRSRVLTTLANCARSPFSTYERLRFGGKVRRHGIPRNPIFIVGHWRSGTTHLHNLMSQDPRFAWLTTGQTVLPSNMLGAATQLIYRLLRRKLPEKRSFDNVRLGVDAPQEEEIALGNLSLLSYFNCYYYPRRFQENFARSVLMQDVTEAERQQFSQGYQTLAARLSFLNGGQQLLFKNPASTARLVLLKELFPEARFIHIVRDPYVVFSSSLRRLNPMLNAFAWQNWDHLDLESIVIDCYRKLMQQYLEQASQIPAGDLVETSYEALVAAPHDELARIFEALEIPNYNDARVHIDYKSNEHSLTTQQTDRIEIDWRFAIDHWGYAK